MKKNLFLTGEPGVGKTTILNQIREKMALKISGFSTLPYYIEGTKQGFYLSGYVETKKYNNNTPISVQVGPKRCVGIKETFETLGVEILEKSLEKKQWILMDELGRLEREATQFQKLVYRCLDSGQGVLGVLKLCEEPWLENIRKREDVIIFKVTKENREDIFKQVLIELEGMLE